MACQRSFYYFYILLYFNMLYFLMEIFGVFCWRYLGYFVGDIWGISLEIFGVKDSCAENGLVL